MNLLTQVGAYRREVDLPTDVSPPLSRLAPKNECWLITYDSITIKAEKRKSMIPQVTDSGKPTIERRGVFRDLLAFTPRRVNWHNTQLAATVD